MRKYHRWLSVLFGIFLLWIAVTGVLSQIAPMVNRGSFFEQEEGPPRPAQAASLGGIIPAAQAHDEAEEAAAKAKATTGLTAAPAPATATAPFVCPADMNCRPKPKPGGWNVGLIHHLHSGETFGPLGTLLSLLSGVAMIFFAFSGLWMYIRMFRARPGQAKWFW